MALLVDSRIDCLIGLMKQAIYVFLAYVLHPTFLQNPY